MGCEKFGYDLGQILNRFIIYFGSWNFDVGIYNIYQCHRNRMYPITQKNGLPLTEYWSGLKIIYLFILFIVECTCQQTDTTPRYLITNTVLMTDILQLRMSVRIISQNDRYKSLFEVAPVNYIGTLWSLLPLHLFCSSTVSCIPIPKWFLPLINQLCRYLAHPLPLSREFLWHQTKWNSYRGRMGIYRFYEIFLCWGLITIFLLRQRFT